MYRPQIKVLDCTIRDGGLINNHQFEERFVRETYRALNEAGVDYIEVGYKADQGQFDPKQYGPYKFCDEETLKRITDGIESRAKISLMIDIGRVNLDEVPEKSQSLASMYRVACYVKDVDKAIHHANVLAAKGYETTLNLMATASAGQVELEEALDQIERESRAIAVYVVDSFGALYSEQIHHYVETFRKYLKTKEVGIHTHNNQQLAFANTIEAIIKGANFLDATVSGIGRGPGNCPMELLLGFLKNPKFNMRPLLKVIQEEYLPLRQKIEWGYMIPYMLTGINNEHPRSAIAIRSSADKDNFVKFYDQLLENSTTS